MDTDSRTTLLLVRHGQSTWNLEHRWQGQADPPLSDHGRRQAQVAADSVGTVDAVMASPQIRAFDTATIISEAIGIGPVQAVEGLRERAAGVWSGLTTTDIEAQYPGWIDGGRRPEGWEPDDVLLDRTVTSLQAIAAAVGPATVLVVSHGGVIVELEGHLNVRDGRIPNLFGRVITIGSDGHIAPGERLELVPPEMATGGTSKRV